MKLFPYVKQIIVQETKMVRLKTGEITRSRLFHATSISPYAVSLEEVVHHIQGHWTIENKLHHPKDRSWKEDVHMLRQTGLGEAFSFLLNIAISFLQQHKGNSSLPQFAKRLSFNPSNAIYIITT